MKLKYLIPISAAVILLNVACGRTDSLPPKQAQASEQVAQNESQKAQGVVTFLAELLNQAAGSRRDDADIQLYLGKSYQQLKRWDDCKSALERALALNLPAAARTDAQTQLATCTEATQ